MVNLTPEEIRRKNELQEKLRTRVLSVKEADELRVILEKERQQANITGNAIAAVGAALLLGLLIAYLADRD
ncbi:hypothetical protein [Nitrosopumilus ureiphilus]|uniref:Uncharacterized protein n=1 Tax=Nitrosopumilus ureiphilus TaxID=1470067 RepID=A0A7D5MBK1_9ARCH|nr:hypothetical protein [Nitrosopumilus ureiphilus]QLH07669.1 hypothetical protein C5F50_11755 [Nitrosopumilus ureiphilus]